MVFALSQIAVPVARQNPTPFTRTPRDRRWRGFVKLAAPLTLAAVFFHPLPPAGDVAGQAQKCIHFGRVAVRCIDPQPETNGAACNLPHSGSGGSCAAPSSVGQ